MKQKLLTLILLTLFLVTLVPFSSAYFYKSHEYWTLKGFEEVDSPMTKMCRPYLKVFVDGVLSADVPVLHYFDNKVTTYIGTHSRGSGLQSCLKNADNDEEKCFCYGGGLHWIAQDRFSHNPGGLVAVYLSKYMSLNFIGHMVIENDFEKKHMALVTTDSVVTSGDLEFYDKSALNSLFTEYGGKKIFLEILSQQAGIDMTQDAMIFRSGYLGEGFYSTVYQDKVSLPLWFWLVSVGLMVVGIILISLALIFAKGAYKWIVLFEGLLFLTFGIIIIVSIYTGSTWKITTFLISLPPKIGFLLVTDKDIVDYNNAVQKATNDYLTTGEAVIDDASGLTYVDRNGVTVTGALSQAEKPALYILTPSIFIIGILINFYLIKKSLKRKK